MIIGYIRVFTLVQDFNNKKNVILNFCNNRKIIVDEFAEVQISSVKSYKDVLVITELSILGRSVSEILNIEKKLVTKR